MPENKGEGSQVPENEGEVPDSKGEVSDNEGEVPDDEAATDIHLLDITSLLVITLLVVIES